MMARTLGKHLVSGFLAAAAVCLLLAAVSCGVRADADHSPDKALDEFFGYISDGDYRSAIEMTGNTADVSPGDFRGSVEESVLRCLSRHIAVAEKSEAGFSGLRAWMDVKIVHVDMRTLVQKSLSEILKETKDYEWKNGSYKTEEEIYEAVANAMISHMEGDVAEYLVTEEIRIDFRFRDGKWQPVMSDRLYGVITGNMSEVPGVIDAFFKEYKEPVSE